MIYLELHQTSNEDAEVWLGRVLPVVLAQRAFHVAIWDARLACDLASIPHVPERRLSFWRKMAFAAVPEGLSETVAGELARSFMFQGALLDVVFGPEEWAEPELRDLYDFSFQAGGPRLYDREIVRAFWDGTAIGWVNPETRRMAAVRELTGVEIRG